MDVVQKNQSSETASTLFPSQTPSTIETLCCNPDTTKKMDHDTGKSDNQFTFFNNEMHNFLHVQSNIQDQCYHCLTLEFAQRVELVFNMMEDVW